MRTLTFGVLIVTVGFVAALPFRKAPTPGTSASENSLATGPTTELTVTDDLPSFDPLLVTRDFGPVNDTFNGRAMPAPERSTAGIPSSLASQTQPAGNAIPSNAQPRPRRDLRLPLTYDDLAVPLDTPHYVRERFGALAENEPRKNSQARPQTRQPRYESARFGTESQDSRVAASPYQQFDSAPASILQREPEPQPVAVKPKRQVSGRLASDSRRDSRTEQTARTLNAGQPRQSAIPMSELPSQEAFSKDVENRVRQNRVRQNRVRHWIRQPN